MRGRGHGPDRRSLAGSALVHVLAVILAWSTQAVRPEPQEFLVYEIEMVAAPVAAPDELVVETPQEAAPREPEIPEPVPEPEPEPEPEDVPPPEPENEPDPPKPDTTPRPRPEPPPEQAEPAATGEEVAVRMEGLRRDYPVYYQNIITQINRCFRPGSREGLEATVQFYITRTGQVEDIEMVRESRSLAFDIEAMGAVECAGGRFGPLPEGLGLDRLPVRFTFRPAGRNDEQDPRTTT